MQKVLVAKPVIPVYLAPQEDTEIETQAVYGTRLTILESPGNMWKKIRAPDGSEGWVNAMYVTDIQVVKDENARPVKSLFAHVYGVNDTSPRPPLLTLAFGTKIHLVSPVDTGERWVQAQLITGENVWIQRGDIDFSPRLLTLDGLIAFGKKFLGLPYTWGGISSFGFDCSGFMQFLFGQMGILLPRNARNQIHSPLLMAVERGDLQPNDLIFFGEKKINHVGLYLGNGEFLHSGVGDGAPIIMISDLKTTKYVYNAARRLK